MKKILTSAACAILLTTLTFSGAANSAAKSEAPAKPVAMESAKPAAQSGADQMAAVNINTADAQELQASLKGVGKVKAEAIVEYRKANGPFTSVDQLLEVKGIGKATLERNRDRITL
ncbi:ComEA family DNA-binding protein [Pseudomonas sp. ZM23]|uniref:ComEA family DNA-binding protein n=1 Tax=Pseudomonas triclosanedens TaxID=2961893 RepID=A0ABY6ZUP5_9PSED|nr:ComEA family DNA-binding protein [Pseudomonas triclosanedens]MCP8466579.1 ComEA family DNA-binding protein [Pseudomonas triclosanedens]MCP8472066.1 ComEA family DNA-binding protein [Pseudomonas triclosanedens]MCP8474550.1 ComEA family DNA-binding protein [Pseudomonas triclosanedens]WAI48071.1 ComEA family DNA-binding protein [Pseudomonas triclosanedens]